MHACTEEQPKEDETIIDWEKEYLKDMIEKEKVTVPTPNTLSKATKSIEVSTTPKRWEKQGAVWCPYAEKWVHLGKCEVCKAMRFKVFTDCQYRRIKNPNDPIFTPTKPRPLI